jgi:hypothetical protein
VALFALTCAQQNFGSYIAECDSTSASVTFVNFPERDCAGVATKTIDPVRAFPLIAHAAVI